MRAGRAALVLVAAVGALVVPAAASAHAYLVATAPAQSAILTRPLDAVELTFDEAVEPRFATISVTDAHGRQLTTASVGRSPSNPDTLVVPLKPHLAAGWYLVYWRAISIDGHPVQGAYTFAVGPSPGAPPEFAVPHSTASATSIDVLVTRWLAFLSLMTATGLFVFRVALARPLVRRLEGTSLRAISLAFGIAAAAALVAVPVYLDVATSVDSLHSVLDVGALAPLVRVTAFGRAWVDLELCLALFCAAAAVALWLDRPERERRSIAELLAAGGAFLAAGALLLVPGIAGHAAQTSPRGVALLLDWLHLVSGSLWLGGLVGLVVLAAALPAGRRVAALAVCVPRFSKLAFVSVLVLLASGVGASILHLPIVAALWRTGYGEAILVKAGLLAAALAVAAVNLLHTKPRLVAARERPELGPPAAMLLRRAIGVESALVVAAVLAAAVLSDLAPPPPALAAIGSNLATVGPGRVAAALHTNGYTLQVLIAPNRVGEVDSFGLRVTRGGAPVSGASVRLAFNMLAMAMGQLEYQLTETSPGLYTRRAPALVMSGRWSLAFSITPRKAPPFTALLIDHATG